MGVAGGRRRDYLRHSFGRPQANPAIVRVAFLVVLLVKVKIKNGIKVKNLGQSQGQKRGSPNGGCLAVTALGLLFWLRGLGGRWGRAYG